MDIIVKFAGTDEWPPMDQPYFGVNYTKDENHPGEDGVSQKGITLNVWEDENANKELDPGELRATYPPGTWLDVVEV